MSEEIRKDELQEEDLESISGGMNIVPMAKRCPNCGSPCLAARNGKYFCSRCQVEFE